MTSSSKRKPAEPPRRRTVQTMLIKRKGRQQSKSVIKNSLLGATASASASPVSVPAYPGQPSATTSMYPKEPTRSSSPLSEDFGIFSSDADFDQASQASEPVDEVDDVVQQNLSRAKQPRVSHSHLHFTVANLQHQLSAFEMWLPFRPKFLMRLFIHDGLGSQRQVDKLPCTVCGTSLSTAISGEVRRCLDCFHSPVLCLECLIDKHGILPFHIVEVNGVT